MGNIKFDLSLYLVTDRLSMGEDEFLKKVEEAIKGGVTFLQLREKNLSTLEYIELGKKVLKITEKYNVPLVIDDRVDVCLAVKAQGVHLGAEDMSISDARRILGEDYIIGATAKTVEKAIECEKNGADYLGCGAVYPTTTKVKTILTPVETIKNIKDSVNIPVAAIGGLNKDNLFVLKDSKLDGVCVVSAIMKENDTYLAAKELLETIKKLYKILDWQIDKKYQK